MSYKKKSGRRISIVIPVYNQEDYLERCLDSVLGQTYRDLEILLIDDGSTDRSPEICDLYAASDNRVVVIHQENRGLSGARNTGIENASSDLIMFCDADDEMLPAMVETLKKLMEKTGADIAQCQFWMVYPDGEIPSEFADISLSSSNIPEDIRERGIGVITDDEIKTASGRDKFEWLLTEHLCTVVQWNKLYKKSIFKDYRYPEGRYHEDEFAIAHELDVAKKVALIKRRLYLYYRHGESITSQPSIKRRLDAYEGIIERYHFFLKKGELKKAIKTYRYARYVIHEAAEFTNAKDAREYMPIVRKIVKDGRWKDCMIDILETGHGNLKRIFPFL